MQMYTSSTYSPPLAPFAFIWPPLSIHALFTPFHPTRRLPSTPPHPQIVPIDRPSNPLSFQSSNSHIVAHTSTQSSFTSSRHSPPQKEAEKLNNINTCPPRTSTFSIKSTHYVVLLTHSLSSFFHSIHRPSSHNISLNIPLFSLRTLSTPHTHSPSSNCVFISSIPLLITAIHNTLLLLSLLHTTPPPSLTITSSSICTSPKHRLLLYLPYALYATSFFSSSSSSTPITWITQAIDQPPSNAFYTHSSTSSPSSHTAFHILSFPYPCST